MAKYYVFYKPTKQGTAFQKMRSLCAAIAAANGDEKRVFQHIEGVPNPWWMYAIKNGKVDKTKVWIGVPRRRLAQLKSLKKRPGVL